MHFGIDHVTVQPEWDFRGNEKDCDVCRTFSGVREAPDGETLAKDLGRTLV